MMNDIAIKVDKLSKKYFIGHEDTGNQTLRDLLVSSFLSPFTKVKNLLSGNIHAASSLKEEFWALNNVSFEVKRGDVVGFIGHNGAGKSTLLKVLSRITEPTDGSIELFGRVASLLEVGTGFHPELTGRENIYLNGAILGMSKAEIKSKFSEIVEFSGVGKFLDTPVKHYSSGMYVRLAFSVAAHLDSEILIIDEVLAVGDVEFQKKCLSKMGDVAKGGKTVLFVSHNLTAIKKLCNKAVWLSDGKVEASGSVLDISTKYLENIFSVTGKETWSKDNKPHVKNIVEIDSISIRKTDGSEVISMIDDFFIELSFTSLNSKKFIHFSFHLLSEDGVTAFTFEAKKNTYLGKNKIRHFIPKNLFNEGHFIVNIYIVENGVNVLKFYDNIASFIIEDSIERRNDYTGKEPGIFSPIIEYKHEKLN